MTLLLILPMLAVTGSLGELPDTPITLSEFQIAPDAMCELRERWVAQLVEKYGVGSVAPMKFVLEDEDLALMGLPSKDFLLNHRFPEPTLVTPDGQAFPVQLPGTVTAAGPWGPNAATFAGTGCFGIRPGAFLLTVTSNEIGWCSMAHVYGTAGSYQISTAGHCGKVGDLGTVIAATGSRGDVTGVVLLDFGKYSKSTGDAGIGKDWALISVYSQYQSLVSPTMCFWGGPFGKFTPVGAVASVNLGWNFNRFPFFQGASVAPVNPNPFLVQELVHYGHGAGLGPGGTPRTGVSQAWWSTYYAFYGAISPGDSGSGSNTLLGGSVGAQRQAAGINTHIVLVDPSEIAKDMGALMIGTRSTVVTASLANGQLVPYPAPAPGLP
jgi:hypothetical protein